MTQIDVLKMAIEAGLAGETSDGLHQIWYPDNLYHFAKLVAEKALAQPEQEPVAWVNRSNLNSAAIERNRGGQGDTHTWSETPTWDHSVPLYTAPPQRKPLTDEQIEEMCKLADDDEDQSSWIRTFARAIEAAHGIKGEA